MTWWQWLALGLAAYFACGFACVVLNTRYWAKHRGQYPNDNMPYFLGWWLGIFVADVYHPAATWWKSDGLMKRLVRWLAGAEAAEAEWRLSGKDDQ